MAQEIRRGGHAFDVHEGLAAPFLFDNVSTDVIAPALTNLTEGLDAPRGGLGSSRGATAFANIRYKNELAPGTEGGFTRHAPSGKQMSVFDAAMKYRAEGVPLVVIGAKEYGTGSSRDWAAKGTHLLGIRAVIAEGLERIHRSNLIGMGVLPLQFKDGATRKTLGLDGTETFDITGLEDGVTPGMDVACRITRADGTTEDITLLCRLDTQVEVDYFTHGGMLHYVLRQALGEAA